MPFKNGSKRLHRSPGCRSWFSHTASNITGRVSCSKSIPVGQRKRKRTSMFDEDSVRIKNEMLLTKRLRKLEKERDFRENPLTSLWIIKIPRMTETTPGNTDETDLDVKDTKITQLLEESDRLCDEKSRLQTLLVESVNSRAECRSSGKTPD